MFLIIEIKIRIVENLKASWLLRTWYFTIECVWLTRDFWCYRHKCHWGDDWWDQYVWLSWFAPLPSVGPLFDAR